MSGLAPPVERQFGQPGSNKTWHALTNELKRQLVDPEVQAVIKAFVDKAKDGDIQAIRELFDRLEGKIPNKLEATVDNFTVIREAGEPWADGELPQ